jgi:hypothetical protein
MALTLLVPERWGQDMPALADSVFRAMSRCNRLSNWDRALSHAAEALVLDVFTFGLR